MNDQHKLTRFKSGRIDAQICLKWLWSAAVCNYSWLGSHCSDSDRELSCSQGMSCKKWFLSIPKKCSWFQCLKFRRQSWSAFRWSETTDWHAQKLRGLHCFCQCYFVVHWGLQPLPVHDRCRACLSPSCVDAKQLDTPFCIFLRIVGSMIRCGSSCWCMYPALSRHGSKF